MQIKIGEKAKKVLTEIDGIRYSKLMNELYNFNEPPSKLIIERERNAFEKVEELVKKYFPSLLEEYEIIFHICDDDCLNDPIYFLSLRKRKS